MDVKVDDYWWYLDLVNLQILDKHTEINAAKMGSVLISKRGWLVVHSSCCVYEGTPQIIHRNGFLYQTIQLLGYHHDYGNHHLTNKLE